MSESERAADRAAPIRSATRRSAAAVGALAAAQRPGAVRPGRAAAVAAVLLVGDRAGGRLSRTCPRSAASPTTGRSCRCASSRPTACCSASSARSGATSCRSREIPKVMQDAVLAIEDARFYQHGGVDYMGVLRAGLANFARGAQPGRIDDHDAGRAQLLPVDREDIHAQDLRDAAGAEDREPAHARSRSSRST